MRPNELIHCERFPCQDVHLQAYIIPQVEIYWQMVVRGILFIIAVTLGSFRRGGGYR